MKQGVRNDVYKAGGVGLDGDMLGAGAGLDDNLPGVGAGRDDMVQDKREQGNGTVEVLTGKIVPHRKHSQTLTTHIPSGGAVRAGAVGRGRGRATPRQRPRMRVRAPAALVRAPAT